MMDWYQGLRVISHRLVQALAIALVLATLCFVFVHALPGDLALRVAAARLGEDRVTPQSADRIRQEEGLDRPLVIQYSEWMGRIATGDLGKSLHSGKPVLEELAYHGKFTLQLGLVSWLLSYIIALPLGLWAGFRPDGWLDSLTEWIAVTLSALPAFLLGIGLISIFALSLRWLPPAGFRTTSHMVLPALTLALGLAAFSMRIIRNAVVEVRRAFFMTYARVQGLTPAAAFLHHGVRNASIPVVTYAALQFVFVIDGFVVIETLFNYPGIGELLVKALIARDVPIIMGASLLIGLAFTLVNLLVDLICLKLDPRNSSIQALRI